MVLGLGTAVHVYLLCFPINTRTTLSLWSRVSPSDYQSMNMVIDW